MASGRAAVILTRIYGYTCLVLFVACVTLYGLWQHADSAMDSYQAKAGKAEIQAMREAAAKRDAVAKWYAALRAKLPKAQRTVADAVRTDPSDCGVSAPVFDGLSRSIEEGNAARRAAGAVSRRP